jgi:iron complex transport system ATP-binding protein
MTVGDPSQPTPLLVIDGLGVELGGTTVLEEVDATADRGRFVGIVGPNGAGKTTLLRTIAGAVDPAVGRVTVDGARIHDLTSKAASRLVAKVPQDTTVGFEFDVRTVVEMGRNPHRSRFDGWTDTDAAAVEQALDRTNTRQFADRGIATLSGGERQRVLLARALAQDAPLLLLDEPTGSLDINHQVRTLELVGDLVSEGRTALAAIHDLDLAARFCDELLLLSEGGVVAAGPPPAVLTESKIRDAFGASVVVSENPVTDTVSVTALSAGDARDSARSGGSSAARPGYGTDDSRG